MILKVELLKAELLKVIQLFKMIFFEGSGSEKSPEANKGGASGGSQTSEESPKGDTVPKLEEDYDQVQRPQRIRQIPRRFA